MKMCRLEVSQKLIVKFEHCFIM